MVSRVYGKTAFKIINVVNINKTPKKIYVIIIIQTNPS